MVGNWILWYERACKNISVTVLYESFGKDK